MTLPKPYSPQTLAQRWCCSAEKIRAMYRNGELSGFQLGKLIRIPANEVDRYECQNIPSPDTEESLQSPIETQEDRGDASRLARLTSEKPKPSVERFGRASQQQEASV